MSTSWLRSRPHQISSRTLTLHSTGPAVGPITEATARIASATGLLPGAAPVVRKVPAAPSPPATPGKLPLPPTTPEPAKPEPAKLEPTKPEPAKVEPTKLEPAKPEPAKVDPPTPAAPPIKPPPPDDSEPPCLKKDPSRQGSGS